MVDPITVLTLKFHATVFASEITRNEFIVPMGNDIKELYQGNLNMGNSMMSLQYKSVRPQMNTCNIR